MSILKQLIRWLYLFLTPSGVRSTIKLQLILDATDKPPEEIRDFNVKQIVVLAPHMDDEVAGCGATLHKHIACGAQVTVVYMTDGRRGSPTLNERRITDKERKTLEDELVVMRKSEVAEAARILGIQNLIFLDHADADLKPVQLIINQIRTILGEKLPEIIYLPSLMDSHCDHWVTNQILYAAISGLTTSEKWLPIFRGFEVWTPLPANRLVNISNEIEIKREAISVFATQTAHIDYVRAISSLNAYRSIYFQRGTGYSEAFYETTPSEFHAIIKAYFEKRG